MDFGELWTPTEPLALELEREEMQKKEDHEGSEDGVLGSSVRVPRKGSRVSTRVVGGEPGSDSDSIGVNSEECSGRRTDPTRF